MFEFVFELWNVGIRFAKYETLSDNMLKFLMPSYMYYLMCCLFWNLILTSMNSTPFEYKVASVNYYFHSSLTLCKRYLNSCFVLFFFFFLNKDLSLIPLIKGGQVTQRSNSWVRKYFQFFLMKLFDSINLTLLVLYQFTWIFDILDTLYCSLWKYYLVPF